jgi:hypothetical protein
MILSETATREAINNSLFSAVHAVMDLLDLVRAPLAKPLTYSEAGASQLLTLSPASSLLELMTGIEQVNAMRDVVFGTAATLPLALLAEALSARLADIEGRVVTVLKWVEGLEHCGRLLRIEEVSALCHLADVFVVATGAVVPSEYKEWTDALWEAATELQAQYSLPPLLLDAFYNEVEALPQQEVLNLEGMFVRSVRVWRVDGETWAVRALTQAYPNFAPILLLAVA